MKRIKLLILLSLVVLLSGCSGNKDVAVNPDEEDVDNNPIIIGQTWLLDSVEPTNSSVPWSLTSAGVSENLYMVNEKGELYSRFISQLEKVDDLTWKATMLEDIKFSNGDVVDAKAVAESMNSIQEKNALSNATAGVITFTPTGDYTFDIRTERPAQSMKSIFAEWTNVIFKELGSDEYSFTGPYMVKKLDGGVDLELTPNPNYPDGEKRSDVTIKLFKDTSAMKLAFESGELDMAFTVTPEVARILQEEGHIVKTIDAGYQYFGIFNLERPIAGDLKVREAINLGINREQYVVALNGGRVANGIFAQYFPFAGTTELKSDLYGANDILDAAGWVKGSDGIREKDGQKLRLNIVTYPSRPDLTTIMQVMVFELRNMGIDAKTEIVDNISDRAKSGDFDLIFYAQHTAPTADPSFFLNQFLRTDQANNFSRYSSDKMNGLLDSMGKAESEEEKNKLAIEAQELIYKDLPVLYLIDPQWHIALSKRLENYQPYGGDYYVVNSKLGIE